MRKRRISCQLGLKTSVQEDKCLQLETHLADHDPADLISALALACLLKAFWEESSQSSQSSSELLFFTLSRNSYSSMAKKEGSILPKKKSLLISGWHDAMKEWPCIC